MTFISITEQQANSLRKEYGDYHALDPVMLEGTSDYILTDAVLTEPAFASALSTLNALPTYPAWKTDAAYGVGEIVEYEGKLFRSVEAHTSDVQLEPSADADKWASAHRDEGAIKGDQPVDAGGAVADAKA